MLDHHGKLETSRYDYNRFILLEKDAAPNPFDQFGRWLKDAEDEGTKDFNAFMLSTIAEDGFPNSRIVLLRDFDKSGLTFFTNYQSSKGRQIEKNNKVCMTFFWNNLERQVRVYGVAMKVDEKESDEYFATRPRESQIGAWASMQSHEMRDRDELEENVVKYSNKFAGKQVPRPPHWGGFRIVPHYFEFWQGRPGRLHDRLQYKVNEDFEWFIHRLAP